MTGTWYHTQLFPLTWGLMKFFVLAGQEL
jgi:hypothetical protein